MNNFKKEEKRREEEKRGESPKKKRSFLKRKDMGALSLNLTVHLTRKVKVY